jgi:hypothetical protein
LSKCEEDEDGYASCFTYLSRVQADLGRVGGLVYALYAYEAEKDDELTLRINDQLVVLDKHDEEEEDDDGWWTCRHQASGRESLVPSNFLGVSDLLGWFLGLAVTRVVD